MAGFFFLVFFLVFFFAFFFFFFCKVDKMLVLLFSSHYDTCVALTFFGPFLASALNLYLPLFLTKKPLATPAFNAALMKRYWEGVAFKNFLIAGNELPARSLSAKIHALICSL